MVVDVLLKKLCKTVKNDFFPREVAVMVVVTTLLLHADFYMCFGDIGLVYSVNNDFSYLLRFKFQRTFTVNTNFSGIC